MLTSSSGGAWRWVLKGPLVGIHTGLLLQSSPPHCWPVEVFEVVIGGGESVYACNALSDGVCNYLPPSIHV